MARVNVYLPDALAAEARRAELNVSALARDAITNALARAQTERWLDRLDAQPSGDVSHEDVLSAIDAAREELGGSS